MAKGLARVDAEMFKGRRLKVPELVLVFLAAVRTQDPTEGPDHEAGRTLERAASAFERSTRALQDRELRRAAAKRTAVIGPGNRPIDRRDAGISQHLRVWLKNCLREELPIRRAVPHSGQQIVASRVRTAEQRTGLAGEGFGGAVLDSRQKCWKR